MQHKHCMNKFRWEFKIPIAIDGENQFTGPDRTRKKIQFDFSGKLHNKDVTGESYILIGFDRYCKRLGVLICKSTETKRVINFLASFINFYGFP